MSAVTGRERLGDRSTVTDHFVGRDLELDKISSLLLGSTRLVTLIGSGGIGKTRLATESLRRYRKAKRTPVYWVRLARLARDCDAAAVEDELTRSVVDADFDFSDQSGWDALVGALTSTDAGGRNLQTVLVMDNCEHVLPAAGQLIAELLAAVPGLSILATSRQPTGWVDEHLVTVPPLTQQQALALFRQRAELAGHPIADQDQMAMADLICRHLDRHPLFIRLAAARLLRQPLATIVPELNGAATDKRMRWPHWPRVGAEARHQGVHDVIAWSYDLCSDKERLLLDRMSAFSAGYDTNPEDGDDSALDVGAEVEAIEAVCSDEPTSGRDGQFTDEPSTSVHLATAEIEGLLERLADQSLVTTHITPTSVRYSLLESIRLFAQQRLTQRSTNEIDEPARLARRHRRYYRDKVVAAQLNWFHPAGYTSAARAAWDNIVTAIETSLASSEPEIGLEISAALIVLPIFKASPREIRRWAERTLQATRALTAESTELQTAAMVFVGWLALIQGRSEDAQQTLDECVAVCISDANIRQNWQQTAEIDIGLPAAVEFVWGVKLLVAHRDPRAITVLGRAREKYRVLGDPGGEGRSEWHEALAAAFLGQPQQALTITRDHLDHATATGAGWAKELAELVWAMALTKHGDPTEALAVTRTTLAVLVAERDQWGASLAVHIQTWSLAQILTDLIAGGSADQARIKALAIETAQLIGGAATLHAGPGVNFNEMALVAEETKRATDVALRILGTDEFAAAYRQGTLLRPELQEVQRLALGTLSIDTMPMDHPAKNNASFRWDQLTVAEQQVAILAAAGWTNTAIAARRGNSGRTVDAQMAAVFHKLGITARADISKNVPQDRTGQVRAEATKRPPRARKTAHATPPGKHTRGHALDS
ncbi:AAA family ATPase [Nocardia sp. NPDC049220]|uniref:ATP-binding protein n=1 Tax=Nocardia sp. NPDC049220 TaxID=3155273 RepID=UPI0033E3671B